MKAYSHMVRKMTPADGFYVSITEQFAVRENISKNIRFILQKYTKSAVKG